MLRSEIDASVNNLINTIEACELVEIFSAVLDSKSEIEPEATLNSFSKFLDITKTYNTFEHQLLKMFNLEKLKDTAFWATLMKSDKPGSRAGIKEVYSSIKFALEHLPKFLILIEDNTDMVSAAVEEGKKNGLQYVNLSVMVIEEQELSSPKRLVLMFEAIQGLYEVVGLIKNLPVQDLIVTACDSGNDKKFDFLGSSEIIKGVKEILLSFWDRAVFFRDDQTGKQLKLITQSLPMVEEINKLGELGLLEKEEAELLRRRVILAINKFSQAGATIPEMEDSTRFDPRKLMRPDNRALVALVEPQEPDELETPDEPEILNDLAEPVIPDDPVNLRDFDEPVEHESVASGDLAEPEAFGASTELEDFSQLEDFGKPEDSIQTEDPVNPEDSTELEEPVDQEESVESEEVADLPSKRENNPEESPDSTGNGASEKSIFERMAAGYLEVTRQETKIRNRNSSD